MMLSAKIAIRWMPPPENMLNMPRMPPAWVLKICARAAASLGRFLLAFGRFRLGLFGLAALRLIAAFGRFQRHAFVLAFRLGVHFLRRSEDFHAAAGLLDRRDSGFRRPVDREIDLALEFAVAEQLHAALGAPHQAGFHHGRGIDWIFGIDEPGIDSRLHLADIGLVEPDRERRVAEAALGLNTVSY